MNYVGNPGISPRGLVIIFSRDFFSIVEDLVDVNKIMTVYFKIES